MVACARALRLPTREIIVDDPIFENKRGHKFKKEKRISKYISPPQINIIFTTYTNINSLKLKPVLKKFSIRCDGRDNTKKLGSFISIVVP